MARCTECDGTGKVVICRSCDSIIVAGQTRPCCRDPRPGPVEDCEACEGEGTIDAETDDDLDDLDDDDVCPTCGSAEECDCEETAEDEDEDEDEDTCPSCGLDWDDCECEEEEEDGTEEEEE